MAPRITPAQKALPVAAGMFLCQALVVALIAGPTYASPFVAAGLVCLYISIVSHWRLGVYGLIMFMPFAGLPTILLYPAPGIVTQSKDLLFVIPIYLGFLLWFIRQPRTRGASMRVFMWLCAAFAALVVGKLIVTSLSNPLVGLIGLKVRLFYLPFFFIGFYFVDSRQRLLNLAKVIVVIGTVPAMIGIIQAALVYAGQEELAYRWYGEAGQAVTHEYARLGVITDGVPGVARVPSTFTFVTQYWGFLFSVAPMAYALAVAARRLPSLSGRWWLVALYLNLLAAITSGARAAYALLPLFFIIMATLEFRWQRLWRPALLCAATLVVSAVIMRVPTDRLMAYENSVVDSYVSHEGLFGELESAFQRTWLGLGTGTSTGPARYALGQNQDDQPPGLEGYYAAIVVELGLAGLMLVVGLLAWLLATGYRSFRRLQDPILQSFGMSLLGLLCVMVVYFLKGSIIDYDPLNTYFWMYSGILAKLPLLERDNNERPRLVPQAMQVC